MKQQNYKSEFCPISRKLAGRGLFKSLEKFPSTAVSPEGPNFSRRHLLINWDSERKHFHSFALTTMAPDEHICKTQQARCLHFLQWDRHEPFSSWEAEDSHWCCCLLQFQELLRQRTTAVHVSQTTYLDGLSSKEHRLATSPPQMLPL